MKTIKIPNTTLEKVIFDSEAEWLAFRKDRIGASDAPIIMDAAKWRSNDGRIKTPSLLAREKWGMDTASSDNVATRYGKKMEAPARKVYECMVGDVFEPTVIINTKYPHLMASLDGLNITNDGAVEIKNTSAEDHEIARKKIVLSKYYPQVQQQLLVTELPTLDYFSFHKNEGLIVKVERDDEYIKEMKEKLDEFWGYVSAFKEPPLTEDDFIERDKAWFKIANELLNIRNEKKELTLREEKLKKELQVVSNGQNSRFGGLRYTTYAKRGLVDYKAIPELSGVNLEKYRGLSSVCWRLSEEKK